MGKRLYVANLPYDVDEPSLREVFGQDGREVERVHIPLDRDTQRPRGFAFIEFASEEAAQQAIAALDGKLLGDRPMRVSVAHDNRRPATGGTGDGGQRQGDRERGPEPGGAKPREARFGPDARPKREREKQFKRGKQQRRRHGDAGDGDFHGRRGSRRFDDDY